MHHHHLRFHISLLPLALLCSGSRPGSLKADDLILTKDTRTLPLIAPQVGVDVDEFGQPLGKAQGKRRVTRVEIVQVIPRRGNNPFNPVEPINNKDGKIIQPAAAVPPEEEEEEEESPPPTGPSINGCSLPAFARYQNVFGSFFEVTVLLDPNTGGCRVRSGFSQSPSPEFVALIIDVDFDPGAAPDRAVIAGPLVPEQGGGYQGPDVSFFPLDNTPKSKTVTHIKTGRRFRITFRTDTVNTGGVRVQSITGL